jgi:tRNA splicing endonuclease
MFLTFVNVIFSIKNKKYKMEKTLTELKIQIYWDNKSLNSFTDDYQVVEILRNDYKVIAEAIGTPRTARRQNKLLTQPFLLNRYDSFYLYEKGKFLLIKEIITYKKLDHYQLALSYFESMKNDKEYKIFKHFKDKGFFVTPGLKFGSNFLLYRGIE